MSEIHPESLLTFVPLSVVPEGDEFLVGDPAQGEFISLPAVGVEVLQALQAGATVAEAAAAMAAKGQDVDVLDFAEALLECGFVASVDGLPVGGAAAAGGVQPQGWLSGVRPELVRPFFSRTAWVIYGLLFLGCAVLFVVRPEYWPTAEDFFFYPDPAVAIVALFLTSSLLGALHELFHWLAAQAVGAGARFRISRRLFFVVFEVDLSQLLAVPRSHRYSPMLAGLAFDTLILFGSLAARLLVRVELLALAPLWERFLGAVVLIQVLAIAWQVLLFFRTDLYAVMVTWLGCANLYRVTYLTLLARLRRLSLEQRRELTDAHRKDLAVARWFVWLYLGGLALAGYFFVAFFIPGTAILAGWMFGSLRAASPGSLAFWEALVIGLVATIRLLLPGLIFIWERLQRRREVVAP